MSARFAGDFEKLAEAVNKLSTQVHAAILQIANTTGSLVSAAEELTATSQQMSANAEETSTQANVVTVAAEEVNKNLQTVATATEEMSASIKDIAKNASEGGESVQFRSQHGAKDESDSNKAGTIERRNRRSHQGDYVDRAANQLTGIERDD